MIYPLNEAIIKSLTFLLHCKLDLQNLSFELHLYSQQLTVNIKLIKKYTNFIMFYLILIILLGS